MYYWFISGFGDFEQLGDSHFAAVDISIMIGVSSVVVQMYFCYRIWTLTRYVWLCMAIAFVCVPDLLAFVRRLTFLNIDIVGFSSGWNMGGLSSEYYSNRPRRLILHELKSLIGGKFAVPEIARISLYVRPRFDLGDLTTSHCVTLVVVDECPGGHYDCDSNDAAGPRPPHHISCLSTEFPFFQLSRASEGYCRFVLIRVVRLTIETNALTGACHSLGKLLNRRESNLLLS